MSYSLNRKISGLTPYEPLSGTYRVRLRHSSRNENLVQ